MKSITLVLVALGAASTLLGACGGSGPAGSAPAAGTGPAAKTETLPRRGEVWEVDPSSPADAQMLAYLYGLHAFVRQGDELFTATTHLAGVREDGSALIATLGDGMEARIEEREGKPTLTFSSGPSATLRQHQDPGAKR